MYGRTRRLQISGFLRQDCVEALHAELAASKTWRLAANRGEQIIDFTPEMLAGFKPEDWQKLHRAVALGGRYGFQFLYETIRLPKPGAEPAQPPPPLFAAFADFMSSPEVVDLMRTITGDDAIAFARRRTPRAIRRAISSPRTTTASTNRPPRRIRLNLTPEWRPDWGGLLLFYRRSRECRRGYTPGLQHPQHLLRAATSQCHLRDPARRRAALCRHRLAQGARRPGRMSDPGRAALEAHWLHLIRHTLPGLAPARDWPVRYDHCFARILLDQVCGGRWYDHVPARPAYRHLPTISSAPPSILPRRSRPATSISRPQPHLARLAIGELLTNRLSSS
jgi:hypothetical protein